MFGLWKTLRFWQTETLPRPLLPTRYSLDLSPTYLPGAGANSVLLRAGRWQSFVRSGAPSRRPAPTLSLPAGDSLWKRVGPGQGSPRRILSRNTLTDCFSSVILLLANARASSQLPRFSTDCFARPLDFLLRPSPVPDGAISGRGWRWIRIANSSYRTTLGRGYHGVASGGD
jgi:hypothetical protein